MKQQFQYLMNLSQSFSRTMPDNDAPSSCIVFRISDVYSKHKYGAAMNKVSRLLETDANMEIVGKTSKAKLDLTAENNQVHYFSMFGMYDLMLVCSTCVNPSTVYAKGKSYKEHFDVRLYVTPKAGYEAFFQLLAEGHLFYNKGTLQRGSQWPRIARALCPSASPEESANMEVQYNGYTIKGTPNSTTVSVTKNR